MLDSEVYDALVSSSRVGHKSDNAIKIKLDLYPIPSAKMLFIKNYNLFNANQIVIKELSGRIVMQVPFQFAVNIESLSNGIYILQVKDQIQNYFAPFVKVN